MNIIEELNEQIREELSISDKVLDTVRKIMLELDGAIKNKEREGKILFSFKERKYKLYWKIYDYRDRKDYETSKIPTIGRGYMYTTRSISLPIIRISGYINKENLSDTLQHEIEHAYQDDYGYNYSRTAKDYAVITTAMSSKELPESIRSIARLLYLSDKNEIDAMVNGLYGEVSEAMKKLPNEDYPTQSIEKLIINSECYESYKTLYNGVSKILISGIPYEAAQYFDSKDIKPTKIITKGERYFLKKLGKVITKLKKDYFEKYPLLEGPIYALGNQENNYYGKYLLHETE